MGVCREVGAAGSLSGGHVVYIYIFLVWRDCEEGN